MKLSDIGGFYSPSFFNIVLETDEDIFMAIDKYTATFVHEFIHYLQDIILPYNIRVNLSKLRWFLDIQQSAIKEGRITRPFNKWNADSKTTILQYLQSIGSNPEELAFIEEVWKIDDAIPTFEKASGFDSIYSMRDREFKVYTYNIHINDISISYNLGARDILEYIAYKIEFKHYPSAVKLPQLPYESIDLLFDRYGLSLVPDDIRLCIAEVCLYNDNPIRFLFVNFLENEEFKQCVTSLNYDKVYKTLLALEFRAVDGVSETITHKTNRRLGQFENDLSLHYSNFNDIRIWIAKVNNFAKAELSNRFIFSDMYKMSKEAFSEFVFMIINTIGLPLAMNNKEECISLQSNKVGVAEFVQFYILQRFLDYVLTEPDCEAANEESLKVCPISSFCQANWGINDECNYTLQSQLGEKKSCPYTTFLKSYGLTDVDID